MNLSIVSPTYNCVDCLRLHLDSVFRQVNKPLEHILVDNFSSDGTREVIEKYQSNASYPVIYIRESDRGIYDAMNKGIRRASGDWIHVFNSDNTYSDPHILEEVGQSDLGSYDFICCGVRVWVKNFDGVNKVEICPEYDLSIKKFHFPHQGMFIRKEFYQRRGLYDPRFRMVSDSIYIFKNAPFARCLILNRIIADLPGGGISGSKTFRNTCETVYLILFHHHTSFFQRVKDSIRQILQYFRYGWRRR